MPGELSAPSNVASADFWTRLRAWWRGEKKPTPQPSRADQAEAELERIVAQHTAWAEALQAEGELDSHDSI